MAQQNLFQLSGSGLVRQIGYDRSSGQPRLVLTIAAREGRVRLLFLNPQPEGELFGVLDTEELWVYREEDGGDGGAIQVEYWADGYHHFQADHVEDLDAHDQWDTGDSGAEYQTGPITGG